MQTFKLCKCGIKIMSHKRRCEACKKLFKARKKESDKDYNALRRDKELNAFYHSKEWTRLRKAFIAENPFCVVCHQYAKIIDHIIPIKQGGAKLDENNLQSLCLACHNQKSSKERKLK